MPKSKENPNKPLDTHRSPEDYDSEKFLEGAKRTMKKRVERSIKAAKSVVARAKAEGRM